MLALGSKMSWHHSIPSSDTSQEGTNPGILSNSTEARSRAPRSVAFVHHFSQLSHTHRRHE